MRIRVPIPIWLIAPSIFVVPAALVGSSARSDQREFKSAFVQVSEPWLSTVTTLYAADPEPGESPVRPRINLVISNRSDRAFWFRARLTAPPPYSGRTGTAHLESKQSVEFESTQDSILADTDYGLEVVVFSDTALTDTLETNSAQFRFDANAVKEVERKVAHELRERASQQESERRLHEEELEAGRLPRTYDSVIFIEGKIGLFGVTGFSRRGTLTVTKDSLQYVSKKQSFAIAGAQLRNVEILSEKSHMCVAVDYDDAGATKQVRFVTGLYQMGRLEKVKASLVALKQQSRTSVDTVASVDKDMDPQSFKTPSIESAGGSDSSVGLAVEAAVATARKYQFYYDASGSARGRVVVKALWKGDPITLTMRFFRKEEGLYIASAMTQSAKSLMKSQGEEVEQLFYTQLLLETKHRGLEIFSDRDAKP